MSKHGFVACAGKTHCLHAQRIEVGHSPAEAPQNVVVEVFVDEQPDHPPGAFAPRARSRARRPSGGQRASISARSASVCSRRRTMYSSTLWRLSSTYEMIA